jgi:hypothetical protein
MGVSVFAEADEEDPRSPWIWIRVEMINHAYRTERAQSSIIINSHGCGQSPAPERN